MQIGTGDLSLHLFTCNHTRGAFFVIYKFRYTSDKFWICTEENQFLLSKHYRSTTNKSPGLEESMTTLKELIPYGLLVLVLASVTGSVAYIGMSAGNPDTRNELQKHVAILTTVNLLTSLLLGFLLYYYVLMNQASFLPVTLFMLTFNMFLGIMSVSIAVLQQLN